MNNEDKIEAVADLYVKATENDWRTLQPSEQQAATEAQPAAEEYPAASQANTEKNLTAAETLKLMNVARSILVNENGTVE